MKGFFQSTSSRASSAQNPVKSFAAAALSLSKSAFLTFACATNPAGGSKMRVSFDTDSMLDIAVLLLGSCGGRAAALPMWANPACSLTNDARRVQ